MDGVRLRQGLGAFFVAVIAAVAAVLLLAGSEAGARGRVQGPVDYMAPFGHVYADDDGAEVQPSGPPGTVGPASAAPSLLTYHGGPVMRTNRTYAIYWVPAGQTVSPNYRSTIDGFFQNVAAASGTRSNVYAASTDFSDTTGAIAYNSTFGGSVVDTAAFPASGCTNAAPGRAAFPVCLSGAQMSAEIQRVVTAQNWPLGTGSLFVLFTPKNVGSCSSTNFCFAQQYCAYHTYMGSSSPSSALVYAVEPYAQSAGDCFDPTHQGSPNHDDADLTINTTSHEHNEAITDPLITAWLDAGGQEDGDKCAWSFGTPLQSGADGYNQQIGSGLYSIQQEWSNSAAGCVLGSASAPAAPTVTGYSPASGLPGSTVTVNGTNFAGVSAVTVGGVSATFHLTNAASMTVTVPLTATTGPVAVTTSGGTGTGPAFTVLGNPVVTAAPTISGTARTGQLLTATSGSWVGQATIAYQYAWQHCTSAAAAGCVTVQAARTDPTYTLKTSDIGSYVRAVVTATNSVAVASASSATTAIVAGAPSNTTLPAFPMPNSTVRVGQALTATAGSWTGSAPIAYAYRWQSSSDGSTWTNIAGATAAGYTPTASLLGQRLRVSVTATNTVGSAAVSSAAATVASLPTVQTAPAFAYPTPHVGDTLSIASGTWAGTGTITYRYQWQYWSGTAWTAISGATAQSYTPGSWFVGRQLRATVIATNAVGSTVYGTAATGAVRRA